MEKLLPKQLKFANEYAMSGNATESAIKAGYSKDTAASQASRLLKSAKIIQYMHFLKQTVEEIFIDQTKKSLETIIELRDSKKTSDTVRLRAAQDILDRAGYKSTDKIKVNGEMVHCGSVTANKEFHIIERIVNENEDVADVILRAMRELRESTYNHSD